MTNTRVGHAQKDETDVYAGRGRDKANLLDTPIGERGWLGNPFYLSFFGREKSIELYHSVFEMRLGADSEFSEAVRELAGSDLGCYCRRLDEDGGDDCHADVIAEHADRLAGGGGGT